MDCLFMEGQIGYCCLMTTVAYVSAFPPQITVPGGGGRLGMFCEVFRGLISRLNFFQSNLDRDQLNRWKNMAETQSDDRMFLISSIEKELQVKSITFTTRLYSDLGLF